MPDRPSISGVSFANPSRGLGVVLLAVALLSTALAACSTARRASESVVEHFTQDLRRQRTDDGTHIRRLSLARTAAWLTATPPVQPAGSPAPASADDATPWLAKLESRDGPVNAVAPPGEIGGSSLRWRRRPTEYLADLPTWTH